MPICKACGAPLGEPDDGDDVVCTACGVMADGAHFHLRSDAFDAGYQASGSSQAGFRVRSYRDPARALPGDSQASERHAANTAASHAFIHALASHVSATARAERATGVFDDLMRSGRYRWGRSAQLLACAALAVSLREANRPQSLAYIAHVANVSPKSLSRTFSRIQPLLRVKIAPSEPLHYLPALHKHTDDLLRADDGELIPRKMREALRPHTQSALRLASSLAALSFPPGAANTTAISIYILALEGALRAKLSHYRQLADQLRLLVNAGQQATYARYIQLYEYLYGRLALVPWLKQAPPAPARKQRTKVDPRDIVARALHDLVKFDPSIPKSAPGLVLEVVPDSDAEDDPDSDDDNPPACPHPQKRTAEECPAPPPAKRPKLASQEVAVCSSTVIPRRESHKARWGVRLKEKAESSRPFYMTCTEDALDGTTTKPLGRLALLVLQRGGADDVADEDLFDEGELEGLLRTPDERDVVARAMEETWAHQRKTAHPSASKKKKGGAGTKAIADWEAVLDGVLAQEGFSQGERELVALLEEDDKAEPWDEDEDDRNVGSGTMDADDWLLEY
ncbi:hypothetical protein AURDEDRAFT_157454 [Auricularia subglabra TFB-10046 SS5]|nr:hypothetical protein AURDEDRAFT_157454 [Auricularia subglabra TFB-10046 SS5]